MAKDGAAEDREGNHKPTGQETKRRKTGALLGRRPVLERRPKGGRHGRASVVDPSHGVDIRSRTKRTDVSPRTDREVHLLCHDRRVVTSTPILTVHESPRREGLYPSNGNFSLYLKRPSYPH